MVLIVKEGNNKSSDIHIRLKSCGTKAVSKFIKLFVLPTSDVPTGACFGRFRALMHNDLREF